MTTALEGVEWSASLPDRTLPPGKTRYPLYRRLVGPQGRSGQVWKISPPPGFNPRTVQPIASRYTDYANQPTILHVPQAKCVSVHLWHPNTSHTHTHTHTKTCLFTYSPPWLSPLTSHHAHPPSYTKTHTSMHTLYHCMMSQWPCHNQLPFSCQILIARSAFDPIATCVIFLMDKAVIEQVSLAELHFSTFSIIPPILHTPLFI